MKKFITILVVLVLSAVSFGAVTVYSDYDTGTTFTYTLDPQVGETAIGSGFASVTPSSYPAGNSAFANALDISSPTADLWYTAGPSINTSLNPVQGTIEMWIAPHWSGTNQGGAGPGLAVGASSDLFQWGATELGGPLNILFFNNGYPNDGGQLFLSWNDGVDSWNMNSSALQPSGTIYGTPYDWIAGQWHHVAVSWDAATVGFYLDGGIIQEQTRTNLNMSMFGNGGYLYAKNTGSGVVNGWDGMVDDFCISDVAKYTPGAGGYTMPTAPIPEPATIVLLGLGGLVLLRKRS